MLKFHARHAPAAGLHFWIALCLASILGCNTGDYYASFFGLLGGLPVLLAGFALVVFLERRDAGASAAFYWLAIVLVRTAATDLADFFAHTFGLQLALAGLAALLALVLLASRRARAVAGSTKGLPTIDGLYWLTMLVAGTLGTALGDFSAGHRGLALGHGVAALVWFGVVAAMVALRGGRRIAIPVSYWLVVVAIRTAGTAAGDYFAHAIGLWQSTAAFAALLIVFLWRRPAPASEASPA